MARRALFAFALSAVSAIALPSTALADVAPEPCEGSDVGEACETFSGDQGTCQKQGSGSLLECVAGGATTAAATTAAATTASASSGGGGGSGGGDGSGGSVGGGETDDGCAVRAPSEKRATHFGAAAVLAVASALTLARRYRRRG